MSRKWSNVLKKINRYFFGEQSDDENNREEQVQYRKKKQQRHTASVGQASGAKVVHRYPKGGNFRFPMDVEALPPRRQPRRSQESENVKPRYQKPKPEPPQKEKKREYFTNKDFTLTHIPSPVHGYQKPPKTRASLSEQETEAQEVEIAAAAPVTTSPSQEDMAIDDDEEKRRETVAQHHHQTEHELNLPAAAPITTSPSREDMAINDDEEKRRETAAEYHREAEHELNLRGVSERPKQSADGPATPSPSTPNKISEQAEERRKQKTSNQAARRARTTDRERKKSSGDASNVMMTPMDRYNYEKRKKQKKERSPSSKPTVPNQGGRQGYDSPPLNLLTPPMQASSLDEEKLQEQRDQLEATLHQFQVKAAVTNVTEGPSIIRFEVQPAPGVKVNKITNLSDDLKLAMAATDLRMEAPIPGKNAIGIEVPKENREPVALRELFEKEAFREHKSPLAVALGLDITGDPNIMDLSNMPHGLIAGATGSGKSVCINSILISLLYKADPEEVKLLLIDPKVVELAFYKDIPHLAAPVVTDPKEATMTLKWSVAEMERRYQRFAEAGVRDIKGYNQKTDEKLPYLVIVIDELADLMMVAPQDVEASISRIAQKARACGIHLLVATQRPSVDVITGLIKANIPTRIAFAVSSAVDSRTILDKGGAERLIGKGDMLVSENGASKLVRLQGTFVSDQEIDEVATYLRHQRAPAYLFSKDEVVKHESRSDDDDLLEDASHFVIQQGSASTSLIQRQFHIGYNRAARLMDMMETRGIVSAAAGTKPRDVLVNDEQLSAMLEK
ncbi:DNA translocase FtsK [Salicibibacter halophilus]|uniref:DNA translocase FtsK n=1 Tax=Salicibibacter halophilus TaxID=2502791 RepID=A0A514LH83_9BACI|nr:DNA translocase FtsK [Salicibibacter halophilus]QDI91213.1 DNA translocase FtsK [Salicibibacter halophilus]